MSGRYPVAIDELRQLLAQRLDTSTAVRQHHAQDESFHSAALPDAVAFPKSTSEVSEIMRICLRHHMPIIPFGAGSALEGGVNACQGGLSLDMSRMNKILSVSVADMDCTVQAGVTRKQLNLHVRDLGVFFPVDPGADASLGGMAATRASGTNAVRYGTMKDAVLSLTVVMADGQIVKTSARARKSSAGYDLTRLFVGSEGTLGIICEVVLRLQPIPAVIAAGVCHFPSVVAAVDGMIATLQIGVTPARIELLDAASIRAVNHYSNTHFGEQPHLFIELHGSEAAVAEQIELLTEQVAEQGGSAVEWAQDSESRSALWQARHDLAYAVKAQREGSRILSTDVCVPLSRLSECIEQTQADIDTLPLTMPLLGHVGDGNFHVVVAVHPDDPEEMAQLEAFHQRLIRRAIAMQGTCTGEHGIGLGKRAFLQEELPAAVTVMARIKRALDPDNLLNPGKVICLDQR